MKKIILYTLAVSLICLNYACKKDKEVIETPEQPEKIEEIQKPFENKRFEPIELTTRQSKILAGDNAFSFKIFKEVSALAEKPNTFFSPLSLNMALGMLYNGTSGETRTEMAEVLGFAGYTETEINEYYQKMAKALNESDLLTEIGIANSIWYRTGFPVKQPFIDINKKYFDAEVRSLDFSKSDAADIINKWCADKTKDKIKEIVENPIDDFTMMYLINALYFKGQWESQFNKINTKQDIFKKSNNQEIKVNMMEQTTYLPYYADNNMQCVEMPYGNRAFGMVFILPANDMNIDQLIEHLDNEKWQSVVDNLCEQRVQFKLPRFKIECDILLNDPVKNVGMQKIFYGGFENISDSSLFVSIIKQNTFVGVNEIGTEAAAVTLIGMCSESGITPPPPIPFFANRPFLYLIKEKSTGAILFIGRMDEPKE